MAFDHPAVDQSIGRRWQVPRAVELGVLIGLTVAVVVLAALWESSSEPVAPVSLSALEIEAEPSSAETQLAAAAETADAQSVQAAGESQAAALEAVPDEWSTAAGIARQIPEVGSRVMPQSVERYQVLRGETLASIAEAQALTVAELLRWNMHLEEDSVLIPGEWLSIPRWDETAVAEDSGAASEEEKSGRGGG